LKPNAEKFQKWKDINQAITHANKSAFFSAKILNALEVKN
jgi:hypothetical protein